MSDSKESPLDLSGLDFGPAWAKDKTPARDYSKEVGPREGRDRRGKGARRDGGGGRQGGGDRRQNNDRRGRGNDRRRNDRHGDNRRNQHREQRVETPAPEGFSGGVMPVEEGLDNLSKEIQGGGRTYSVFDLARVVMGARERFNVTFEAPKNTKFFRCKSDGSLWLNKDEAVRHFWQANLLSELYEEVETEVEAPKGNFTSVAKCGLSNQWLAPPNYHSYPTAIAQMHAERFAHMSLEDYKRKIRVESGEEVVAAWLETQTKKSQFRPLSTKEILALREARKLAEQAKEKEETSPPEKNEHPEEAAPAAEETSSPDPEATGQVAPEEKEATTEAEATPGETATEPEAVAEEKTEEETPVLLDSRRDVERHFADHHFPHIFAQVERAWVPGSVSAKLLSPALLTLLKATVADERRYPSKLTPILCRQLSGRHLAVFKWKKKLKAGPARPHAVPDDIDLAERPQKMLAWITGQDGKTLEELWKAVLPENADKETKQNFYHDFHWLLNQGFVLLMADSTVHLAKAKVKAKPASSEEGKPAKEESQPETEATSEEPPKVEVDPAEAPGQSSEEKVEPVEEPGSETKADTSN